MKYFRFTLYIYAIEAAVITAFSITSYIMVERLCVMDTSRIFSFAENVVWMKKTVWLISFILVPIESFILYLKEKHDNFPAITLRSSLDRGLIRFLCLCRYINAVSFLICSARADHIAEKIYGFSHGSDEYMFFQYPVSRIIWVAFFTTVVIAGVLEKIGALKNRWWYTQ